MKFSKQALLKLKNKNKRLKPSKYKILKRNTLRGRIKGTSDRPRLSVYRSNENIYAQINVTNLVKRFSDLRAFKSPSFCNFAKEGENATIS